MKFVISTLEFVEMQKNRKNKKVKSILGPKLHYLGILGLRLKNYRHILNEHLRICKNPKFRATS